MFTLSLNNTRLLLLLAFVFAFSACNILGSSETESSILSIEETEFVSDDLVTIKINNTFNHDIYVHKQSSWSLEQKIGLEWKAIYTPIADTGPPRFNLKVKAGELKVVKYPAMPNGAMIDESGHNEFRYRLGLFSEPDPTFPLSEKHRITTTFQIDSE